MGLESVEFVLELEARFGVKISDAELVELRNVNGVVACLSTKLPLSDEGPCLAQLAFFRLRQGLMAVGIPRERIRPESHLKDFASAEDLEFWERFRAACGWCKLSLRRPILHSEISLTGLKRGPKTLRELIGLALLEETETLLPAGGWTRQGIRVVVRNLIVQKRLAPPDFADDADFIRDLGWD